jgi:hypothetical protein
MRISSNFWVRLAFAILTVVGVGATTTSCSGILPSNGAGASAATEVTPGPAPTPSVKIDDKCGTNNQISYTATGFGANQPRVTIITVTNEDDVIDEGKAQDYKFKGRFDENGNYKGGFSCGQVPKGWSIGITVVQVDFTGAIVGAKSPLEMSDHARLQRAA